MTAGADGGTAVDPVDPAFERLLGFLKQARHFDFTGYKRPSLARRVRARMQQVGLADFDHYQDHLEANPEEFAALFDTVLINVTGFFRDADVWDHLGSRVLPRLLARRPTGPIRVWSAGCASGEEAYSLAILLAEQLGTDAFRSRVKVYATDADEGALAEARAGTYSGQRLGGLSPQRREAYFETQPGGGATFRRDLRRSIIFGRNDLVQDAPISRVDLLVCRNTLMYFDSEQQGAILARFNFALVPRGVLVLGKAEMILGHGTLFRPVDLKWRLFERVGREGTREAGFAARTVLPPRALSGDAADLLRDASMRQSPVATLVVSEGRLALANDLAETLLGVDGRDVGRPFQDLEISYRPVELRAPLDEVVAHRLPVRLRDVVWDRPGRDQVTLDVQLVPVVEGAGDGDLVGVSLFFNDLTRYQRVNRELAEANGQVAAAYEELQSTNEELETTNEELQSTIEELETTNEELQATNEELETVNEELQSMNDQIQATNVELRQQTSEIEQLNELLEAVLTSQRGAVVVVDGQTRILLWNRRSEELWGLRGEEVLGQYLFALDIGLPLAAVRTLVEGLLEPPSSGHPARAPLVLGAHDRRGRPILVSVTANALVDRHQRVGGVILVADELPADLPGAPPAAGPPGAPVATTGAPRRG